MTGDDSGAGATTPGADAMTGARFGEFVVARRLAAGGMAEVFLGARTGPSGGVELAAIKRLLPHLTWEPDFVRMFLAEVRISAGLRHPNIAATLDFGTAEGGHFLAVEYVHGRDVRQMLGHSGDAPPPVEFAVGTVLELASALQYAHTFESPAHGVRGLIHRDISPSNVMLGFDGAVKLLDFGIARAIGQTQHTRAGTIKGKAGYMSPEQCRGETVDRRTDIFALGVILYELSTSRRAFCADNDFAVMAKILSGEYTPARDIVAGFPGALEAIIAGALATDAKRRTPDAATLRRELTDLAAELGLDLRPERRAQLMRHWFDDPPPPQFDPAKLRPPADRRNRGRTVAVLAAFAAAVGAAGFFAGSVAREPTQPAAAEGRVEISPAAARDLGGTAPARAARRTDEIVAPPAATPVDSPGRPTAVPAEDPAPGAPPPAGRPSKRGKKKRGQSSGRRPAKKSGRPKGRTIDPESLLPPSLRE